jgi:Fe-S cluster assembly protein SufD
VFNGKVYVRPVAQKTDGKQTNKTLLLSEQAQIDTKPQLEIFADDVKCTHGATVGRLDQTALFYLKSRGLTDERGGQAFLTYAFAARGG